MSRRRTWSSAIAVALVGTAIAASLLGGAGLASSTEELQFAAADDDRIAPLALTSSRSGKAATAPSTLATHVGAARSAVGVGRPTILHLRKSSRSFNGDVRNLPQVAQVPRERPERDAPESPGGSGALAPVNKPDAPTAPAPSPIQNFAGMAFSSPGGQGHPPDTNADVGPNHVIETINVAIAIYNKTGVQQAQFNFNTFMSQGAFGNLCDTANFGDPVVLYDSFEDRWIITDFAFQLTVAGAVISPPGSFECFAVSKTGDPVAGGWNFYSIQVPQALPDYPKFGIWPDGLYMTTNNFGNGALSGSFVNSQEWAFNKAQMYAGHPSPQIVAFNAPRVDVNGVSVFTAVPSNARLQTGKPPVGRPNYFVVSGSYQDQVDIWKFHVDWDNVYNSTLTGPFLAATGASWGVPPGTVPSQGGNNLDTLATRTMMQVQYTNLSGVESVWTTHTVLGGAASTAAPRWYQTVVTGDVVAANTTQASTHTPDTTVNRFMGSLALDRAGNMLLGYSASNSSMKPALRWAGRLSGDALNSLPQTEVDLIAGTGTQVGNCGPAACTRWGDYSSMALDPSDGCTFWFAGMYYAVDGLDHQTRIGSTKYPSCTAVGNGTVSGTVTQTPGGTPIGGATVMLGSRSTTTTVTGQYTFAGVPAGTYPIETAGKPGYTTGSATNIVVPNGGTATQDFALPVAATSGCLTDTSQADFSLGTPLRCDAVTSPGDLKLSSTNLDQINESVGGLGFAITATNWSGMTFIPSVTGQLTKADIALFCSNGLCTGTPNLTLSVRATSGGLPTGADLATAPIAGFSSGASVFRTGVFASPATLTAGTQYALIIRPDSNPSSGNYDITVSGNAMTGEDMYTSGTRVGSATSGASWSSTALRDAGFRTYMTTASGTFVSGLKDSNPSPGQTPSWTTISWTASIPANTTLRFQVAGSNNPFGPFTFVGPDTTAATFYTVSGGALAQFNGLRYLKYKAYLDNTDNVSTPTINDVSVCFSNAPTTSVGVASVVATRTARGVAVSWRTRSEARIAGFNVYRGTVKANRALLPARHAGKARGASYRFLDRARSIGPSRYRIQVVGVDGRRTMLRASAR
jgi:hypothetical protein